MGDGVKGSIDHLDRSLRQGVQLHRAIDSYTDEHTISGIGRERLRAKSGKYAGVVLDMFYDHILSVNWDEHHDVPLPEFLDSAYRLLTEHVELMPPRTQFMLPHMVSGDWLGSYASMEGLSKALNGLAHRASNGALIAGAEEVLEEHYAVFTGEFNALFYDVRKMCETMINEFDR